MSYSKLKVCYYAIGDCPRVLRYKTFSLPKKVQELVVNNDVITDIHLSKLCDSVILTYQCCEIMRKSINNDKWIDRICSYEWLE